MNVQMKFRFATRVILYNPNPHFSIRHPQFSNFGKKYQNLDFTVKLDAFVIETLTLLHLKNVEYPIKHLNCIKTRKVIHYFSDS